MILKMLIIIEKNNHLHDAIDALEAGDVFEANGKLNDFRHEIKKQWQHLIWICQMI